MKSLRTQENRFKDLPDYVFTPHYFNMNGVRIHYIDENTSGKVTILMLHGEPSWSYLYRHMIPICTSKGYRVIAPDLIGFGKSDKPIDESDYTYTNHINWIGNLIQHMDLKNIILFGQDWGSLIGLRLVAQKPDRFSGVIIANGFLPTGEQKMPFLFKLWKLFVRYSLYLPIGEIINFGSQKKLSNEEKRAYNAPFPTKKYMKGVRAFPKLIPDTFHHEQSINNRKAWEVLKKWDKPFATAFGTKDPITRDSQEYLVKNIPGALKQEHLKLEAGHFIQEDCSVELAGLINRLVKKIHEGKSKT